MSTRFPLSFVTLMALALPFGLAACHQGNGSTSASSDANVQQSDQQTEGLERPNPPSEFDNNKVVPDGSKSADGQVIKNIAKYTLPTHPYIVKQTGSAFKVQQIFYSKCMKNKNVNVDIPDIQFNPDKPIVTHNPLFTVEDAKFGYTGNPTRLQQQDNGVKTYTDAINRIRAIADIEAPVEGKENTFEVKTDPEKAKDPAYAALRQCDEEASKELAWMYEQSDENKDTNASTTEDFIKRDALRAEAHFNGEHTPQVQKAAEQWKACMAPLGIADLPDNPNRMPSPSLAQKWFPPPPAAPSENQQPVPQPKPSPGADQIALATKDAECRESSGFNRTYYDVHWGLLDAFLKENREELQKHMDKETALEKKRQDWILQNQ